MAVEEDSRLRVEKAQQGDARRQLVNEDNLWRWQARAAGRTRVRAGLCWGGRRGVGRD